MKALLRLFVILSLLLSSHMVMAEGVNINTADAQTLASTIVGVGQKKAQAIIDFREEHGDFKSIDELTQVKGIGLKLVEKNRDKLTVKSQ